MNIVLGVVAATLTLTQTWESPTPADAVLVGPVTRYDKGLMAQVLENRGIITDAALYEDWLSANGYVGAVSLEKKGDRFRSVWINGEGPFYVADCRELNHYPGDYVAEVDYKTAMRWKARGPWPGAVVVSFVPPIPSRVDMVQ